MEKNPQDKGKKPQNKNQDRKKKPQNKSGPHGDFKVNKAAVKQLLKEFDWSFCMEIFWESYDAIRFCVEILTKQNKLDEAYSMIYHTDYDIKINDFPQLKKHRDNLKVIPDRLWKNDKFGPLGYEHTDKKIGEFLT